MAARFRASSAALATLPGIGRSTAAAIAAFCFGERAAILDGNVKRVLTRVLGFGGDLAAGRRTRRACGLPPRRCCRRRDIEVYTQGLMDLGATRLHARAARTASLPAGGRLRRARRGRQPEAYPVKTRKLKRGQREQRAAVAAPPRPLVAGAAAADAASGPGCGACRSMADGRHAAMRAAGWPATGRWLPACSTR